eukprot:TRINITY_DN10674_c0_g1_i4.p1 TRINITY_DN10674_c0_g1~~TRINITY_DN10674_c0_g1_i4.p1  ORF type:complete len:455 (-),score=80.44 TRINITY_DN10674_c0_g1_i4:256-1620(-)
MTQLVSPNVQLSATANEFVPGSGPILSEQVVSDEVDVAATLNSSQKRMLRHSYYDPAAGIECPYYVGRLKSYSNSNGFGFLSCPAMDENFGGSDIFIHKNHMPHPWRIGQPCEFAITLNQRSQPQAVNVLWLPMSRQQGQSPQQPAVSSSGGYNGIAVSAAAQAASAPPPASGSGAGSKHTRTNQPRRLGSVKSYSPQSGYGFIECTETREAYERDVYLDGSQIPKHVTEIQGRLVEFDVQLNPRGQPQARNVRFDPVPLNVPEGKQPRSEATIKRLKDLLALLHKEDYNSATITAINHSGGDNKKGDNGNKEELDVDYTSYVLERATEGGTRSAHVMEQLKEFTRMLLLLMFAKMLKKRMAYDHRTGLIIHWLENVVKAIVDPCVGETKDHFGDVAHRGYQDIENYRQHLRALLTPEADQSLGIILSVLKEKLDLHKSGCATDSSLPTDAAAS